MVARVVFGNLGSGQFGLKVSKPGVDVLSALDRDLVFSSLWPNYGVVHASGTLFSAANVSASFPDLGYTPLTAIIPLNASGALIPYQIAIVPQSSPDNSPDTLVYPIVVVNRTSIRLIVDSTNMISHGIRYCVLAVPV